MTKIRPPPGRNALTYGAPVVAVSRAIEADVDDLIKFEHDDTKSDENGNRKRDFGSRRSCKRYPGYFSLPTCRQVDLLKTLSFLK